ncbi:MAG: hypothetical protein HC845_08655 [Akkermansiaceae bacterium]|nr:hypothetical protein [Akkermansiaceae bacterium]
MTEQEFLTFVPADVLLVCREAIQNGFEDYASNYSHVADAHSSRTVRI